ncbi:IS30 family transposase [Bradyrhizobium yuanmingense]|uniref:IS30 family transposase n=1 Tax=Bradyrhizobium yuanmingense TaxID=108015 RepID=UPI0023B8C5FE|nr:IS30 family transposase [Bradyrhizobium yuanmingense]MDF0497260.1 IS30 family transposase [Bradyrhizobium yuanmingense]
MPNNGHELALDGLSARPGARPAPRAVGAPRTGLVTPGAVEQVARRFARDNGRKVISYETIYRFIYGQLRRTSDCSWRRYLPRGKSKRGCRGKKKGSAASFIEGRLSLAERPVEAADRNAPGHWEADLMMFSKYGQAVLTMHERTSRLLLGIRLGSKLAVALAGTTARVWLTPRPTPSPPPIARTRTRSPPRPTA